MSQAIILIHPSRLFSEGVRKICEDGCFKLAHVVQSFDCLPIETLDCAPVFIVGGKSGTQTLESISAIRRVNTAAAIIVVGDGVDLTNALSAGANCYLRDTANPELLLKTLDLFTQEEVVLPAQSMKDAAALEVSSDIAEIPHQARPIHLIGPGPV